jgi:hypothetical protein
LETSTGEQLDIAAFCMQTIRRAGRWLSARSHRYDSMSTSIDVAQASSTACRRAVHWRRRLRVTTIPSAAVATLVVTLLFGCSEDEPPERPVCPEPRAVEARIVEDAVVAFDAYMARQLGAAAPACAAIIEDLRGTPPAVSAQPTVEELEMACGLAKQAVQDRIPDQAVFDVSIGEGGCDTARALKDCEDACGEAPSCALSCPALATLATACDAPPVTVMADEELEAALTENLPSVAPLVNENPQVQSAANMLNMALVEVLASLDGEALCGTERDAVAAARKDLGPLQDEHAAAAGIVADFLATMRP